MKCWRKSNQPYYFLNSHTRSGHCSNVFLQLHSGTVSSIIGGSYPHPVHIHGFEAFHTEWCCDEGAGITAGPFDAVCLPYVNEIAFSLVLNPWFLLRFSPCQDKVGVGRFRSLQTNNLPRRFFKSNTKQLAVSNTKMEVVKIPKATLTFGISSENKFWRAATFARSWEVHSSDSELIFHPSHNIFNSTFLLWRFSQRKNNMKGQSCGQTAAVTWSCADNTQTFDEVIHSIDGGPEVASLLALFQNVAEDTWTSAVTWCFPSNVDTVIKGTDHHRRSWRTRKSWREQIKK